jgi:hypothetical protein
MESRQLNQLYESFINNSLLHLFLVLNKYCTINVLSCVYKSVQKEINYSKMQRNPQN